MADGEWMVVEVGRWWRRWGGGGCGVEAVRWRSCGDIREMASGQLIVIISKIIIYASLTILKTFIGGHRRLRSHGHKRAATAAVKLNIVQRIFVRLRVKHIAAGAGLQPLGRKRCNNAVIVGNFSTATYIM